MRPLSFKHKKNTQMAQYQIKKEFQNKRLVVDGVEITPEFLTGDVKSKLKAFPSVSAFVEEVAAKSK
jgi:hypothetical protein